MPNDLPPWNVVYQQAQRWIRARCFETMVEDLRMLLREFAGRKAQPTAMILDRPHAAIDAGIGSARRLRRGQATQGIERTCGSRYAGAFAGPACDSGRRARSRSVGELPHKCSR